MTRMIISADKFLMPSLVIPKSRYSIPNDLIVYKFIRDSSTPAGDWNISVSVSDWKFVQEHSVNRPISTSLSGSELHISSHSPEDILGINIRSFHPFGFLIQTW